MAGDTNKYLNDVEYQAFTTETGARVNKHEDLVKMAETLVQGVSGYRQSNARQALDDELRKIASLRKQSRVSALGARLLAGRKIREVNADIPGFEGQLRQQTEQFFGKFGEGDMLLQKTDAEKRSQDLQDLAIREYVKAGVKMGTIHPNDPENPRNLAWTISMLNDKTARSAELNRLNLLKARGEYNGSQYADAYINDQVTDSLLKTVQTVSKLNEQGQLIEDPDSYVQALSNERDMHKIVLRKQLKGKPETLIKSKLDAIDALYKPILKSIKDGSYQTWVKNQKEMIVDSLAMYGAKKFPDLFAVETVLPGASKELIGISNHMANMQDPKAKQAYFDNLDPLTRKLYESTMGDPAFFKDVVAPHLVNTTEPEDKSMQKLVLSLARRGVRVRGQGEDVSAPRPDATPDDTFQNKSIAYLLEHSGHLNDFDSLNNPSTKQAIASSDILRRKYKNKYASRKAKVLTDTLSMEPVKTIADSGENATREVFLEFDSGRQEFTLDVAYDGATGNEVYGTPSEEELNYVKHLNSLYKALGTYSDVVGSSKQEFKDEILGMWNKKKLSNKDDAEAK